MKFHALVGRLDGTFPTYLWLFLLIYFSITKTPDWLVRLHFVVLHQEDVVFL